MCQGVGNPGLAVPRWLGGSGHVRINGQSACFGWLMPGIGKPTRCHSIPARLRVEKQLTDNRPRFSAFIGRSCLVRISRGAL